MEQQTAKTVKVKGLLPKGAWHTGGKIQLDEVVKVSAEDAKILLARKQVEKI